MNCINCGTPDAPHDTDGGPMCSDCLSACCDCALSDLRAAKEAVEK
jgi:hypothetical protein